MTMLSRRALLAITLPAVAAGMARAEDAEDYPTRQVTFIVPFAPAGGTDILARMLGQKLEQRLNKSFVVENRPGAGTVIATNFVANSPPDGYTISMTVSSLAIDVTLYKKLPYDVPKDLAMVALIASVPFVLVVSPSLPVTSVDDLIKLAKQRPLSYGSGGIGAFHHLAAALFCSMAGIKMTHVPYRGSGPAMQDLQGGRIDYLCDVMTTAKPPIDSGAVKGLAVLNAKRSPALPDVPTAVEQGMPDLIAYTWNAIFLPKNAPAAIVKKLHDATLEAMHTPTVRDRLTALGAEISPDEQATPQYLGDLVKSEIAKWAVPIKASGVTVE